MNESHNGKSSTQQAMKEVAGCTHAMHGNDVTKDTIT